MNIKPVNLNQTRQLGFGSKIVITEEVKRLVKTRKDAISITALVNAAEADEKDILVKIGRNFREGKMFGNVYTENGTFFEFAAHPTDEKEQLLTGYDDIYKKIESVYKNAVNGFLARAEKEKAQEILEKL